MCTSNTFTPSVIPTLYLLAYKCSSLGFSNISDNRALNPFLSLSQQNRFSNSSRFYIDRFSFQRTHIEYMNKSLKFTWTPHKNTLFECYIESNKKKTPKLKCIYFIHRWYSATKKKHRKKCLVPKIIYFYLVVSFFSRCCFSLPMAFVCII